MRIITIPEGIEQTVQGPVNKRGRFFDVINIVVDNTKLKVSEIIDLSTWLTATIEEARKDGNQQIKLQDKQWEALNGYISRFELFVGRGSLDTILAFKNAEYIDETKMDETKKE
jgi:hypothetical protein